MIDLRCWLLALLAPVMLEAAPIALQSSVRQTSLVELYTSEGCSSCPPAEEWLSGLKESPALWKEFVPVAFHVDYWNSLGWRDQWSSEQFSDRQREYAASWNTQTIYTPEFVLNGREWHISWRRTIPAAPNSNAGLLKVNSDDARRWHVAFAPARNDLTVYQIHAALLVAGVSSDVKAGENAGRHLKHDFAVAAFTETPLVGRSNIFNGTFFLDSTQKKSAGRLALAVWLTPDKKLEPVQALGGWLP